MKIAPQLQTASSDTGSSNRASLRYHDKLEQIEKKVKKTNCPKLVGKGKRRNDTLYNTSAPCRGWCLIFCNATFKSKKLSRLDGHIRDAYTFERIFKELKFKPVVVQSWDIPKLKHTAAKYANSIPRDCGQVPPEGIVVIILTHGGDKNKIIGRSYESTDKNHQDAIDLSEFQEIFNNDNCPLLQRKPKLFFVQACRGGKSDAGVPDVKHHELEVLGEDELSQDAEGDDDAEEDGSSNRDVVAAANDNTDQDQHRSCSYEGVLPTVTDMFTCQATAAGYTSFVHHTGSVFGVNLAWYLIHHAHDMELLKLVKRMSGDINVEVTDTGRKNKFKQSPSFGCEGWTKDFYFNPGYPKLEPNKVSRKRKAAEPKKLDTLPTLLPAVTNSRPLLGGSDPIKFPAKRTRKKGKFDGPPPKNQPTIKQFFQPNPPVVLPMVPLSVTNEGKQQCVTAQQRKHFAQFRKKSLIRLKPYCSCVVCDPRRSDSSCVMSDPRRIGKENADCSCVMCDPRRIGKENAD